MRQGPPPELRGIQESTKPHKFFERHLQLNGESIAYFNFTLMEYMSYIKTFKT